MLPLYCIRLEGIERANHIGMVYERIAKSEFEKIET